MLDLPPDLAAKVQERIDNGEGASAEDVLRAGMAALDAEDARKFEALKAKIARALADPRPSVPADEAFDRVETLVRALIKT